MIYGLHTFTAEPRAPGLARPPRFAYILGLGLDTNLSAYYGGAPVVRGTRIVPDQLDETDYLWSLFVDGVRVSVQSDPSAFVLDAPGGDFLRRVDILGAWNDTSDDLLEDSTLFWAYPIGDTIVLHWTDVPDEDDFAAYCIYYDEGDGWGADTLLATLTQRDLLHYVAQDLTAGTYVFKILYKDQAGNIGNGVGGDNALTVSATVNPAPNAPTVSQNSLASFASGVSRDHTFTQSTIGNTEGIVGYYWFTNQDPIEGELPFVETALQHGAFRLPASSSFTIGLFPGAWKIACASISAYGALSMFSETAFRMIDDGAGGLTLVQGEKASPIYLLTATSIVDGDIRVRCESDVAAGGGVLFYRDAVQIGDEAYSSGGVYTVDDTGLVDGTSYAYTVRAYDATDALGELSHEVDGLSDATPPSGDQVLTATVRGG